MQRTVALTSDFGTSRNDRKQTSTQPLWAQIFDTYLYGSVYGIGIWIWISVPNSGTFELFIIVIFLIILICDRLNSVLFAAGPQNVTTNQFACHKKN